jgi:Outer membrane lipoprotein carrier protein LolA
MLLTTTAFFAVVQMMGPLASPAAPAPLVVAQAPIPPPPAAAAPATKPAPAAAVADPKLDAVVDAIQKTYEGTTNFTGSFTQKFTYTMLRRTQESTGKVTFEKPGRMRWDYTTPTAKSFIVDQKALWIVQPEDKVAFVNACFKQDGLTASVAFLWGDGKLKEQFTISWFDGVFGAPTDEADSGGRPNHHPRQAERRRRPRRQREPVHLQGPGVQRGQGEGYQPRHIHLHTHRGHQRPAHSGVL